jgi:hypothetical protein
LVPKGFGINPKADRRIAGGNQFGEYKTSLIFAIDDLKMVPAKRRLLGRPL